jgi:hypothetical protein
MTDLSKLPAVAPEVPNAGIPTVGNVHSLR